MMPDECQSNAGPPERVTTQLESDAAVSQHAPQLEPPSAVAMQNLHTEERLSQTAGNADSARKPALMLRLSGDGWALPIRLDSQHRDCNTPRLVRQTPRRDTLQARVSQATSECSSYLSTANTIQLSGQHWAMPVSLHGPLSEEKSPCALQLLCGRAQCAPVQAMTPLRPQPQLAIKAGTQTTLAQELPNSLGGTSDAECKLAKMSFHVKLPVVLLHFRVLHFWLTSLWAACCRLPRRA